MAYNPKTGKGLGRFYDANHRAFRAREWRGFRDTLLVCFTFKTPGRSFTSNEPSRYYAMLL